MKFTEYDIYAGSTNISKLLLKFSWLQLLEFIHELKSHDYSWLNYIVHWNNLEFFFIGLDYCSNEVSIILTDQFAPGLLSFGVWTIEILAMVIKIYFIAWRSSRGEMVAVLFVIHYLSIYSLDGRTEGDSKFCILMPISDGTVSMWREGCVEAPAGCSTLRRRG